MNTKPWTVTIPFISLFIFLSCEPIKDSNRILDESFDDNKLGWVEEHTGSHYLDISNGYYRMISRDSVASRSSSGSLKKSYLVDLPEEYAIESSIKLVESKDEEKHFGIILVGASLEYAVSIYPNGWVLFTEYDYNLDSIHTMNSKYIEPDDNNISDIKLDVEEDKYQLKVNDIMVGTGEFKMEPRYWYDLRLYTSKETAIAIDDLKIKK